MEDKIASIDQFKTVGDGNGGQWPHYLILIYHKILVSCLHKYSTRATSEQVSVFFMTVIVSIATLFTAGYGDVE